MYIKRRDKSNDCRKRLKPLEPFEQLERKEEETNRARMPGVTGFLSGSRATCASAQAFLPGTFELWNEKKRKAGRKPAFLFFD